MGFFKRNAPLLLTGAAAGFINGLLGAGGGIIITFYLSKKLDTDNKNDIFANAVATMLPISIFSLALYVLKGHFPIDSSLLSLLPAGIVGGIIGAFLLTRLRFPILKTAFSILMVISGILMIFR